MLASAAIRDARRAGLPADSLSPTGSLRRYAPDIGDVSVLATAAPAHQAEVIDGFARLPSFVSVLSKTSSSVTAATSRGTVTLHVAAPEHAGAALAWHTGSRAHTNRLGERAKRRNLRFADGRLQRADGTHVVTASESDVYRHLGLPYIPPELREGADEIEAAESG